MISKKAQEEIVGFVAIVLVVSMIGLVFLGLSIRSTPSTNEQTSENINSFLDSALMYTSDCAIGYQPNYASLKDLISNCHSQAGTLCVDERNVCSVLNETVENILNASWPVSTNSNTKGYEFDAVYSLNASEGSTNQTNILSITNGNCSTNYEEGDSFFSLYPGVITTSLKVCY